MFLYKMINTLNSLSRRRRLGEDLIQILLFLCGAVSMLITVGIVLILGNEAFVFFRNDEVTLLKFFTESIWQPSIGSFGILPLVNATLMVSLIAMLVAIPIGVSVAIYLSEYAKIRTRAILKPILEILAGIPTVVYGYFALTFMTPLLRKIFGGVLFGIFNHDTVQIYNTA